MVDRGLDRPALNKRKGFLTHIKKPPTPGSQLAERAT
jgi:hypothetical protein